MCAARALRHAARPRGPGGRRHLHRRRVPRARDGRPGGERADARVPARTDRRGARRSTRSAAGSCTSRAGSAGTADAARWFGAIPADVAMHRRPRGRGVRRAGADRRRPRGPRVPGGRYCTPTSSTIRALKTSGTRPARAGATPTASGAGTASTASGDGIVIGNLLASYGHPAGRGRLPLGRSASSPSSALAGARRPARRHRPDGRARSQADAAMRWRTARCSHVQQFPLTSRTWSCHRDFAVFSAA